MTITHEPTDHTALSPTERADIVLEVLRRHSGPLTMRTLTAYTLNYVTATPPTADEITDAMAIVSRAIDLLISDRRVEASYNAKGIATYAPIAPTAEIEERMNVIAARLRGRMPVVVRSGVDPIVTIEAPLSVIENALSGDA